MPARPTDNEVFNSVWSKMADVLQKVSDIVRGKHVQIEQGNIRNKMEWYALIYDASTKDTKIAEKLYTNLHSWVERDLEKNITDEAKSMAKKGNAEHLFRYVAQAYGQYKIFMRFGKSVFGYLDQYYTKKQTKDALDKMYLKSFHKAVYINVRKDLRQVILRHVTSRRDGNNINIEELRHAVGVFVEVGRSVAQTPDEARKTYEEDFERQYVDELKAYYHKRGQTEFSREGGHYVYLQWVETRFELENQMGFDLLDKESHGKIITVLENELLANLVKDCVTHPQSGFAVLLEDWKERELKRMYVLFKRVRDAEGVKMMKIELSNRLIVEGTDIVNQYNSCHDEGPLAAEKPFVEAFLELHAKYTSLIVNMFENHQLFQEGRKDALEKVYAQAMKKHDPHHPPRDTSCAEILALYLDAVMRRDLKDIVDPDAEMDRIDKLVTLFSYIKDKDVFQEYYKAKLAKRLLQTTPNDDMEKAFLEKVQRLMGKSFTNKMEGMINDRENTRTISERFRDDTYGRDLPIDFQISVLTAGHWPAYKTETLVVSPKLHTCTNAFTLFYKKQHATRMLNWIHMLGSAQLQIKFPKGPKDVTCSIHQATVLSLVDNQARMCAEELAKAMKLDKKIVNPQIASMYISKGYPLLVRIDEKGEPMEVARQIGEKDTFAMNPNFRCGTRKFKLPTPSTQQHHGDPDAKDMDARRRTQIDACVVRIMKSRRTLTFQELVSLSSEQLSKLFPPQGSQIKKRIEDLINRGYMERDKTAPNTFNYLA